MLNVVFNAWFGLLLVAVAAWLLWELWSAVAPKPITDDFLKLLDDSFGRDWRRPRTWPWRGGLGIRLSALGAASVVCMALLISAVVESRPAKAPAVRVETSQRFRPINKDDGAVRLKPDATNLGAVESSHHENNQLRAALGVLLLALPASAQWGNLPSDGVPLGKDGKQAMTAQGHRSNGKPDLSGIYQPNMKYVTNLAADLGIDNVPMTVEARKIYDTRKDGTLGWEEPDAHCLPQGVPKINSAPVPFKIVQTDKLVVLVYEAFNLWRQVHLDGREFAADLNPSWLGFSKGRWEGDELVVETRGLNGKQWLDHAGLPASDKLTVVERFRRPTFGKLEIELTINDPTYYTKPWKVTTNARWLANTELFEFVCNENEKSTQHMGPNAKISATGSR